MIIAIVGLVLTVGGLIFWIYPRISLEPGESLDPYRPFETPFFIRNDGYWSIVDIDYVLNLVKVEAPFSFIDCTMKGMSEKIPKLRPSEGSVLFMRNILEAPPGYVKSAEVYVCITFRPSWLPLKFTQRRRFKTERKASGEYVWIKYFSEK